MLADMHCHYPMRVAAGVPGRRLPGTPKLTVAAMTGVRRRPGWLEKLRAAVLKLLANLINYGDDKWRVDLDQLTDGEVRVVFSVLYEPFAEFDLDQLPGTPSEAGYFGDLIAQLDRVEADLESVDPDRKRHEVVRSAADLDRVVGEGKAAFMHCVEGGFHLGSDPDEVRANVAALADRNVVYVTLAHLFWRGVAGNAPAIPFLGERAYRTIFPMPREGLSELGRAAVEEMYRRRILIDVSHMSQRALDETFALLERLDREHGADPAEHPVIASHAGYRFGVRGQEYMLSPATIRRIAERDGVIGLILARHQLNADAEVRDADDPAETPRTLCRHIDAIRAQTPTGSNAHVAIGSDLDGFIKPTVAGIETAADLATLRAPLEEAYEGDAAAILHGNAMRVARRALGDA